MMIEKTNRKPVAIFGILICLIYFALTLLLVLSGSQIWLTLFEMITMISGVFMVVIITVLPFSQKQYIKYLAIIFACACMILTNVAHFVNLTVTEQLLRKGVYIPEYLQIGFWPSVEMAMDYLGWGLFMGLSFIYSFMGLIKNNSTRKLRWMLLVSGILCFFGLFGTVLINENMWYIAPVGYGFGTLLICIELLVIEGKSQFN